jgi:hypothetical protein
VPLHEEILRAGRRYARVREAVNQKNRDQRSSGQQFKGWGKHTTPESRDINVAEAGIVD